MIDKKDLKVVVVVDAFRAFATASYVLEQKPKAYMLTTKSTVVARLASQCKNPLLIGKPEQGINLAYDIPNSPTRVQDVKVADRHILHRTTAGAKGILLSKNADIILAAGIVNADATASHIMALQNPTITILPMGHEGTTPSLEDNICAEYIEALINGKKMRLDIFLPSIKKDSGRYFFTEDQWQYPREDFDRCLKIRRFNFAIQATVMDDYALLTRC